MKPVVHILVFLFVLKICLQQVNAQESFDAIKYQEQLVKYEALMWNNSENGFDLTEIPTEWKDESKVGLCKSYQLVVENRLKKLYYTSFSHERIKLLDRNALKEYSEFSFDDNYKSKGLFNRFVANRYVGFKVVKSNGTEYKVDIKNAVDVTFQQNRFTDGFNKVAIPGLEVGDIIDFFYINEIKLPISGYFYNLPPNYYLISDTYPVLKQYFTLKASENIYINARSVNGAPRLKLTNKSDGIRTYEFEDTLCAKVVNNDYLTLSRSLPHLKMQIYYSQSPTTPYSFAIYSSMIGARLDIKDHLDVNSLSKLSETFSFSNSSFYTITNRYLIDHFDKKKSAKADIAKDAYYFLREYNLHTSILREASNQKLYSGYNFEPLNQISSLRILSAIFIKWKVPFKMVYTVPNSISKLNDWLFVDEIVPMIEVCAEDTFLISNNSYESLIDELPQEFSGNEGYSVKFNEKKAGVVYYDNLVSPYYFPTNKAEDNQSICKIEAEISSFEKPLSIAASYQLKGASKAEWDTLIISNFDKFNDTFIGYSSYNSLGEGYNNSVKKAYEKLRDEQIKFETESTKKIDQLFKDFTGLENLKFDSSIVLNTGRWLDKRKLDFNLFFSLSDAFVDVGTGYLFPIGAILKNELEPILNDTLRYDFKTRGPYLKSKEFSLVIPDSYTIPDVSGFQIDFKNECGEFHLNAHFKSNTLVIGMHDQLSKQFFDEKLWANYKELKDTISSIGHLQLYLEKIK